MFTITKNFFDEIIFKKVAMKKSIALSTITIENSCKKL